MNPGAVRLIASPEIISELQSTEEYQVSEPQPLDSSAEPLNTPLAGAEIIEALQVATVVFGTANAIWSFSEKIANLLNSKKQTATIVNPRDASRVAIVSQSDDSKNIEAAVADVQSSTS